MAKKPRRRAEEKVHPLKQWPPIRLSCNREALPEVPVHSRVPQQTELGGGGFEVENS